LGRPRLVEEDVEAMQLEAAGVVEHRLVDVLALQRRYAS
jgi:hypothetical protein